MTEYLPPLVAVLAMDNAGANAAINETIVEIGKFGATVKEQAVGTQAAFDEVTASVARMAEASQASLGEIDRMTLVTADDIKAMALATEQASARMESAQAKAAAATDAFGKTQTNSQAAFSSTRTGVTIAAAAFDFLGIETIKAAGSYQSSTQKIVSSGGEIQANIDKVRQGMLDMTAQVGYSADELSSAFYKASSAGFNFANGGLQVLQASAEGAKTEQADLTLVTDAVTSAMVDYHKGAADAATVTSQMVAATSAGKMTFQDLAGSLHSVLPNASAAHVSFTDILGDLAAMTVHGMSADQAAQNLNDVITHMQSPTATQAKELALLGMTTNQLADDLRTKGLSGTLQEISDRIRKFSPPGTDKVILDLRTALNGLSPAVRELGMHLFDGSMSLKEYTKAASALDPISAKQATSFATLAGSTHRIGDEQLSGIQVLQNYGQALFKATGDHTGLNTALMLTGDNLGVVDGAITAVADAHTEAGNHVKGWAEIQQTFNQRLSDAKAGFGAMVIEIGTHLLPVATKFVGFLSDGTKWLERHHTIAKIAAVTIGILAMAFTALSIAMWAASITPVGLIIAGIIGVIALLALGIYELVKHWNKVWKAIKDAAEAVWNWIKENWPYLLGMLTGPIGLAVAWIYKHWDEVVEFVEKLPGRIAHAAEGMWDGIKDAFRAAVNWIIDHWNGLKFSLPSFDTHIPGIGKVGGFTIEVPQIPRFDDGGWVPGSAGQAQFAIVHGGEFVLSREMIASMRGGGSVATYSAPFGQGAASSGGVETQVMQPVIINLGDQRIGTALLRVLIPAAQQQKARSGVTGLA